METGGAWAPEDGDITPPFEYTLIQAAKYLGVAPWELAEAPMEWMTWAARCAQLDQAARKAANRSRPK